MYVLETRYPDYVAPLGQRPTVYLALQLAQFKNHLKCTQHILHSL